MCSLLDQLFPQSGSPEGGWAEELLLAVPLIWTFAYTLQFALMRPRPLGKRYGPVERLLTWVHCIVAPSAVAAATLCVTHDLTESACAREWSVTTRDLTIALTAGGGVLALLHPIVVCSPRAVCAIVALLDLAATAVIAFFAIFLRTTCEACTTANLFSAQTFMAAAALCTLALAPTSLRCGRRRRVCDTRRGNVCATRQISVPNYLLGEL